jgi:Domain of unknown function (DUF222)
MQCETRIDADALARRLAEATPVVAGWDDLDFDGLSSQGRIDALVAYERLSRHAQALLTRALGVLELERREVDDLSTAFIETEVCVALNWSSFMAQNRLGVAGDLVSRFPETLDAVSRGEVCFEQARALSEWTAVLEDEQARAVQARVLPKMPDQTRASTRRALSRAVKAVDPEAAAKRHQAECERRRVQVIPEEDGMATLALYAPAQTAAAMLAAVDRLARERTPGDERTLDQRRADTLAHLILSSAGVALSVTQNPGIQIPALVQITVGIGTLLGTDQEPAELRGYGPIDATQARALAFAPGSVWRRLITAPDGVLVHADPHTYRPTAAVDRFVRARDRHCAFPGCAQPAHRCDLDHVTPFRHDKPQAGGLTEPGNLHALCRRHHRLKTAGLWSVTRDADTDTATWTSRTGHRYTSTPALYPTAA